MKMACHFLFGALMGITALLKMVTAPFFGRSTMLLTKLALQRKMRD
jgi:hypothetical protein